MERTNEVAYRIWVPWQLVGSPDWVWQWISSGLSAESQLSSDKFQLATHILKTTTTGKDLRVTRLTCNSGVNFRNRYHCWSQWPIQCIQLWSQLLLVWIWIFWKFIHHRMSVSSGLVLSLKIEFLHSIRVSRTSTRLSSHFYPAFRLLKRRDKSEFL